MTSKVHPYKTGMGPYAAEVYRAPFPSEYRGPSVAQALAAL
jgi:4-aminobutyrate aminotransferase/(S)-3-amino-2-methylpropionate transaminase